MANEYEIEVLGKPLKYKQREGYIADLKRELMEEIGTAQAIILLGKTPKGEIRKRLMNPKKPAGPDNPMFSYLEHAFVEELLNLAFQLNWDAVVEEERWNGDDVEVRGYIEVRFPKGGTAVRRTGFGGAKYLANNPNMSRADAAKAAYSDMIKNAATKLGIGLDLYRHEERKVEETALAIDKAAGQPSGEQLSKPATENQLATIRNLGGIVPEGKELTFGEAAEMIAMASATKNEKG
jgi:hypothetical protein